MSDLSEKDVKLNFITPALENARFPLAVVEAKNFNSAQEKIILHFDIGQNRSSRCRRTGTGKTFTTFQIVWKVLKSKKVQRVLYLADRNILINQTISNDFKPLKQVLYKVKK